MKQMLEQAILKSKLSSAFQGHPVFNREEQEKLLYFNLMQTMAKYLDLTDRANEFLHKLGNGLAVDRDKGNQDVLTMLNQIKEQDEEFKKHFLIDLFILFNLSEVKETSIKLVKELFYFLKLENVFVQQVMKIAKYIVENCNSNNSIIYPEIIKSIKTGVYRIDKDQEIVEDTIFLDCQIICSGKLTLRSKNIQIIDCELFNPDISINGAINSTIKDCIIKTSPATQANFSFYNIHRLHIENNTLYETLSYNFNFKLITHYSEQGNKLEYLSKKTNIKFRS